MGSDALEAPPIRLDSVSGEREVAAIVVLFQPDAELPQRIETYRGQVGAVIAIDNSEPPDPALAEQLEASGIDYFALGENRGVASALNVGCQRALERGYGWALTMDQDSAVPDAFVDALTVCLDETGADRIAVIAPLPEMPGVVQPRGAAGCDELTVALTSASLLRLAAFAALGGFREELFIDQVDHEFCLRAKRSGWRIVRQRAAVFDHRLGSRRRAGFPWRWYVSDYSPLRRYYMVRNTLELRREFGREFPDWLSGEYAWWRRELVKMILSEPDRVAKLRMMWRGWRDYRRRRLGRFEGPR
jgi:rhamnosyltransferase